MKVRVKKIWHDCVSVRDYIVQKAIDKKERLEILYAKERMIVDPKEGIMTSGKFTSKYDGRKYALIDFKWDPITSKQEGLFK